MPAFEPFGIIESVERNMSPCSSFVERFANDLNLILSLNWLSNTPEPFTGWRVASSYPPIAPPAMVQFEGGLENAFRDARSMGVVTNLCWAKALRGKQPATVMIIA